MQRTPHFYVPSESLPGNLHDAACSRSIENGPLNYETYLHETRRAIAGTASYPSDRHARYLAGTCTSLKRKLPPPRIPHRIPHPILSEYPSRSPSQLNSFHPSKELTPSSPVLDLHRRHHLTARYPVHPVQAIPQPPSSPLIREGKKLANPPPIVLFGLEIIILRCRQNSSSSSHI